MQTDRLFHEYFSLAPEALLELFQIQPACAYRFSSPVLKSAERRLDGLLEPVEPGQPIYFFEVQGYEDRAIYWRCVQELGLYFTQHPVQARRQWQLLLLFLDPALDPGIDSLGPLATESHRWLGVGTLLDLLKAAPDSPVLHVLRPLAATTVDEIRQEAPQWVAAIHATPLMEEALRIRLVELLTLLIVQKFSQLPREEIDRMLQLTPLEETRAVRELIEEGIAKGLQQGLEQGIEQGVKQGIEQGIEQGELILLKRQLARRFGIQPDVVAALLRRLRREDFEALSDLVLEAESFAEIRAWIQARTRDTGGTPA
jgi:predicted transposase YdaD